MQNPSQSVRRKSSHAWAHLRDHPAGCMYTGKKNVFRLFTQMRLKPSASILPASSSMISDINSQSNSTES